MVSGLEAYNLLSTQGGPGFSVTCDMVCKLCVILPTPAPSTQNTHPFLFSQTSASIPQFPGRSSTHSQMPPPALTSPFRRFACHRADHGLSQWSLFCGSLDCEFYKSKDIVSLNYHFIRRAERYSYSLGDIC